MVSFEREVIIRFVADRNRGQRLLLIMATNGINRIKPCRNSCRVVIGNIGRSRCLHDIRSIRYRFGRYCNDTFLNRILDIRIQDFREDLFRRSFLKIRIYRHVHVHFRRDIEFISCGFSQVLQHYLHTCTFIPLSQAFRGRSTDNRHTQYRKNNISKDPFHSLHRYNYQTLIR